jgi:hypothetical protein
MAKVPNEKDIYKEIFLFRVGSAYSVKWLTSGWQTFRWWRRSWNVYAEMAETTVKRLLCCGFRRVGKVMGHMYQCWWMTCQEIIFFLGSHITYFTCDIYLCPIYGLPCNIRIQEYSLIMNEYCSFKWTAIRVSSVAPCTTAISDLLCADIATYVSSADRFSFGGSNVVQQLSKTMATVSWIRRYWFSSSTNRTATRSITALRFWWKLMWRECEGKWSCSWQHVLRKQLWCRVR